MQNGLATVFFEKSESHSKASEMNLKTLKNLVRHGESITLEFKLKTNHPEKIVREMVAFANTEGGTLLVGIGDDKTISGLKFIDEDEFILVRAIEKYCYPPLPYRLERVSISDTRDVLVFQINKSGNRTHGVLLEDEENPKVYVRVADRCVQASKEVRQILKRENEAAGVKFIYGQKEQILMQYLEKNQRITVDKFTEIAQIPRWLASRTLVLLSLAHVLKVEPHEVMDWFVLA